MDGQNVCVLAAPALNDLAQEIVADLNASGLVARVGSPSERDVAVVLLLARELPEGINDLDGLTARLVPVKIGLPPVEALPATVAELNWIVWDSRRPQVAIEKIVAACQTNTAVFHATQSLEARVQGWVAGGRRPGDVIADRRGIQELRALESQGATFLPATRDFVAASEVAYAAVRRRARLRSVAWVVLGLVLLTSVAQTWRSVQSYRERSLLLLLASSPQAEDLGSYVQVPKFAGLVMLSDEAGEPAPLDSEARLAQLLSSPGPIQVMSVIGDGWIVNGVQFTDDGDMLLAASDGTIWRGHVGELEMRQVDQALFPNFKLAADAQLGSWITGYYETLTLSGPDGRATLSSGLEDGPDQLIMQADGGYAIAIGEEATELYSFRGEPALDSVLPAALGVGEVNGRLTLVAQDQEQLSMIDAATGDELRRFNRPATEGKAAAATVMPDGEIVVSAGGRLWVSNQDDELTVIGVPSGHSIQDLRAVGDQLVLLTTVEDGTQLIDLNLGVAIATLCNQHSAPREIDTSHDGRWLACRNAGTSHIWDLDDFRPATGITVTDNSGIADSGDTHAHIEDGALVVGRQQTSKTHDLMPGSETTPETEPKALVPRALTAVALSSDGHSIAYGSSIGALVVADLSSDLDLLVTATWQSPNGAPITAIKFQEDGVKLTTTDAVWQVQACLRCRLTRDALWANQQAQILPCYNPGMADLLPPRLLRRLGLTNCEDELA